MDITLQRPPKPIEGNTGKNPDFIITNGPEELVGKRVDFMYTDSNKKDMINLYFAKTHPDKAQRLAGKTDFVPSNKNLARNKKQFLEHLSDEKADIVPVDFRNLTPENRKHVFGWIDELKETANKVDTAGKPTTEALNAKRMLDKILILE